MVNQKARRVLSRCNWVPARTTDGPTRRVPTAAGLPIGGASILSPIFKEQEPDIHYRREGSHSLAVLPRDRSTGYPTTWSLTASSPMRSRR